MYSLARRRRPVHVTGMGQPNEYFCHQCQYQSPVNLVPMPICALCSSEFVEEVDAANPPPPTIGSTGRMLDQDPELELDLDLNIDEELARIFESTLGRAFSSIESTDNVSDTEYHDTVADVSDIPHTYDYDYHSDDEFASLRFEEEAARQRVRQRQQLQEVQRQQAPPTPPSSAPPRNALARAQSDLHETSEPLSRVVTGSVWDRLANIVRNQSRGRHVHISSATSVDMLATRNLRVGDEDIEQECAICQDIFGSELTLMRMPCDHEYHEICLRPWLEMNTTCPICRSPLPPRSDLMRAQESALPVAEVGPALFFSRFSGMYDYETLSDEEHDDGYELPYPDNVEDNLDNRFGYDTDPGDASSIYTATDDESDLDEYDENGSVILWDPDENEDRDEDEDEDEDGADYHSSDPDILNSHSAADVRELGASDDDEEEGRYGYEESESDYQSDYQSDNSHTRWLDEFAEQWLGSHLSNNPTDNLSTEGRTDSPSGDYLDEADAESERESYPDDHVDAYGYFESASPFNAWRHGTMYFDSLSDGTLSDHDTDNSFYGLY